MSMDDIIKLIKSKKQDINDDTLKYYANYFWVLSTNKNLMQGLNIDKLIDNALLYASEIVFYDEKSEIYKKIGPDCKGLRDPETKTIYIRYNLDDELKEITIYHELHHAVQTNPDNDNVGINQNDNFGRMIMEAQTQYFAEVVYQQIHNVVFEEKEIPSEKLRMQSGGTIVSSTHNYEMYDSILSKLSIIFNVPKDFFVYINYLYKDNKGLEILKEKYKESKEKYKFEYSFEDFMFLIDYIYCVDLIAYHDNADKEIVLSGKETENSYTIHENRNAKLSLKMEFDVLDDIDRSYFTSLLENGGNYYLFKRYVCKDATRELIRKYIPEAEPENASPGL